MKPGESLTGNRISGIVSDIPTKGGNMASGHADKITKQTSRGGRRMVKRAAARIRRRLNRDACRRGDGEVNAPVIKGWAD